MTRSAPASSPTASDWIPDTAAPSPILRLLLEGDQSFRAGIPGVKPGTCREWKATHMIIKPHGARISQLFHDGGQLWPFHLVMSDEGDIRFNRRPSAPGLPRQLVLAEKMVGKPLSIKRPPPLGFADPDAEADEELAGGGEPLRQRDNHLVDILAKPVGFLNDGDIILSAAFVNGGGPTDQIAAVFDDDVGIPIRSGFHGPTEDKQQFPSGCINCRRKGGVVGGVGGISAEHPFEGRGQAAFIKVTAGIRIRERSGE
jgi:hypothetical protein